VDEVCPNLYADVKAPESTVIALPDGTGTYGVFFEAALRFLKGLLGLNSTYVSNIASERKISVRWQEMREYSYDAMDKWFESGESRPIARRCRLAIDDLKAKHRFKARVFVIVRAISAESLTYEFGAVASGEGSASAQLWKDLNASAQAKAALSNGTRLEIKNRLFVADMAATRLRDWLPLGQGEIVKMTGDKTDLHISGE